MMRAMFAAISGLKSHQTMLDVTSNDIANVNTIGYKASRATFEDSLAQLQRGASAPAAGSGGTNAAQVGLGAQVASIDNLMSTGSMQTTGNPLDVAIQGGGLFRVATSTTAAPSARALTDTGVEYTRAGNFTTNSAGYLVTQDGMYVQGLTTPGGTTPTLIQIPSTASSLAIGADGSVSYVDAAGTRQTAGYLSLATFPNQAGLQRLGDSRWGQSANSGSATVSTPNATTGSTIGGEIEMSNVDLAQEFTQMITAERGYQANSRVITTADEMLQDLVNMKH